MLINVSPSQTGSDSLTTSEPGLGFRSEAAQIKHRDQTGRLVTGRFTDSASTNQLSTIATITMRVEIMDEDVKMSSG